MEREMDIEDEYLLKGAPYETLTERCYNRKYFIEPEGGGHYRLLIHSNKICLITLAPSHPIVKKNLNVKSVSFQANESCNRLDNKVSGKKKIGAQFLTNCSILCTIHCEDHPTPFIVRSNLVAKLMEMNETISSNPEILKDIDKGFIAVVHPKLSEFEREINRWMPEEEYLAKVQAH